MSQKPDIPPERQARQHKPAIIAIVVALLAAVLAFVFFGSNTGQNSENAEAVGEATVPGEGTETAPSN